MNLRAAGHRSRTLLHGIVDFLLDQLSISRRCTSLHALSVCAGHVIHMLSCDAVSVKRGVNQCGLPLQYCLHSNPQTGRAQGR